MIKKEITYGYKDLGILAAEISYIRSRSECNPFYGSDLPIFASPMTSVVSEDNYNTFRKNNVTPIIPRNKEFKQWPLRRKYEYLSNGQWVALGLKEFEEMFCDETLVNDYIGEEFRICVDVANGHMASLYDACKKAKKLSLENNYSLTIMTGNINNPKTYDWVRRLNNGFFEKYDKETIVIDYIRLGIGGGEGCFVDGTKVTMSDGNKKNIEEVNVGETVISHDGSYNEVTSRTRYMSSERKVIINGEITCTDNHKFYVVNKDDVVLINEENVEKFAFWVEAKNLDKSKHLLIKREAEKDV